MTYALDVHGAVPEQNSDGAGGQNRVHFYFEMVTDTHGEEVPDIDWDTIDVSFKRAGEDYELVVNDGTAVAKHANYVYLSPNPIGTGEGATGVWATGQHLHRGFFMWLPPFAFPDGRTFWIKIELNDELGNSYSEEWYWTVRAVAYSGPVKLYLLKRTADTKASQRFGVCAFGIQSKLESTLKWSKDCEGAPVCSEVWVEPVHIPGDVAVALKLGQKSYDLTEGDWLKIEADSAFDNGLPFEGGDSMDVQLSIISSKAQTARDRVSLTFLAICHGVTGACPTGLCATGGIGLLDELSVDFSMYAMSQQTTEYYRDSLGMTVAA